MANGLIPPNYQAVPIGSAANVGDLSVFTTLEEGTAEGSLMLMRLDFTDFPTAGTLAALEKALRDKGVPSWPGYGYVVYADASSPSIYLAWQKGFAWLPIILGVLLLTVLPTLLGAVIWWLIPQPVKDIITGIINMGMMLLIMNVMMSVMKPLTATVTPKQVKKPEETKGLEEAKT